MLALCAALITYDTLLRRTANRITYVEPHTHHGPHFYAYQHTLAPAPQSLKPRYSFCHLHHADHSKVYDLSYKNFQ